MGDSMRPDCPDPLVQDDFQGLDAPEGWVFAVSCFKSAEHGDSCLKRKKHFKDWIND